MSSASILLVDDEADLRNTLADSLRMDGYSVETAPNGKEALAWLDACPFAVVVTDLNMPGGPSGIELIAAIKARSPHIVCVVITGYASLNSAIEAIQHGAYDFIRKPFRIDEMEAALDRSLEYANLQNQLANYHRDLENRVMINMNELKAFQTEGLHLADLLKVGLRESSMQAALRPLLTYLEERFQPDGYAILTPAPRGVLSFAERKGELDWPEAEAFRSQTAVIQSRMAEQTKEAPFLPLGYSETVFEHEDGNGCLNGFLYPDDYLCPLDPGNPEGGWLYLGFCSRSSLQAKDPLFLLWCKQLSVLLDVKREG